MHSTLRQSNVVSGERAAELRTILEGRRQALLQDLRSRVRQRCADAKSSATCDVFDTADVAEMDTQDELDFALMQIKTEMLERIQHALVRLESGDFGFCFECHREIAEQRLRALPFALRCTPCEEAHERRSRRPQTAPIFPGSGFDAR